MILINGISAMVITAFCQCRKAKQTRFCLMRSKVEHVENVAKQVSSVMLKLHTAMCIHSTHLSHTAADYKCQPFPAVQDHEKAPAVYLACLHL